MSSTTVTFDPYTPEGRAIAEAAIAAATAGTAVAPRRHKATPERVKLVVQEHDDDWHASIREDYYTRRDLTLARILEQHGVDGHDYRNIRGFIYGNLFCHGDPDRPLRRPNRKVTRDCGGQLCKSCARCIAIQAIGWHRDEHGCPSGRFHVPGVGVVEA